MKAVFVADRDGLIDDYFMQPELKARIQKYAEIVPDYVDGNHWRNYTDILKQADIIFSAWGMLKPTKEEIATYLPNCKAVFYAAGSVQAFARPFLESGITVTSSWKANSIPVAEHTLALIILSAKGYFQATRLYKEKGREAAGAYSGTFPGMYGVNVGILGAGMIGKKVIELLQNFRVNIFVYDPFLNNDAATAMGVVKLETIEEVFEKCLIVSNHIANLPATRHIITKKAFDLMADNGVFINTGRGAQLVEADLIAALNEHPNRTAILDVTDPEPVPPGSPLYDMPQVVLSPHVAGSMQQEIGRMMEYAVEEFERMQKGEPLQHSVTLKMLETMA